MKKILSFSIILGVAFNIVALGIIGPTNFQVQAAENNKLDVFISFDKIPGPSERAIVNQAGGIVRYSYTIVPAIAASIPEMAIQGLLNNPRVKSVELDGTVYAVDAELDNAWGVERIGSGTVHDANNKGAGIKIGIIDSGVDYGHQDLNDIYAGGYDFVDNDTDPADVYGHGTHVAGTACAEDNNLGVVGVAPECELYSLRVLNDSGSGSWSATIAAMEWAVTYGLQVVNLSLGSSQDPGSTVKAAFDNAEAAGLVIVAAGGNSGNPRGKGNNVIYPAKYASVIAVAAVDENDQRASWSSTGEQIELAAPGVSILSAWNDENSPYNPQPYLLDGDFYKQGSGTSMASPHVAGAAALVIAAGVSDNNNNGRINDEVRTILNSTADDLGPIGKDTQYGYGLVNVVAAVAAVVSPPPPSPPSESTTAIVDSITYTTEGGRFNDRHLNIYVSVIDNLNNPVANASVSIGLYRDDNLVATGTGTTGSNGLVIFNYKNAPSGTYTTEITNVTVSGLFWDGETPPNSYSK